MLQLESPDANAAPIPRVGRMHPALIVGVIGTVIGFAGSWIPSYWGDEAASVLSASRTWPSLGAMLLQIDGVHGLYYGFLKVWTALFGTSEAATRAPSAIAVGFMVAGTVVLARRFVGTRIAVIAGIIAAVLPRATYMAGETRSYAIGAAAAVWITVLLVRTVRPDASRRLWLVYGLACAAAMYLFLYLGLVLVVHGIVVALLSRARWRMWARAAGFALLLAVPILVVGAIQREQIGFLARRHYATAANILTKQWFGYPLLAVAAWLLILTAAAWLILALVGRRPLGARMRLTVLTLTWLVAPTVLLLIGNALLAPMYNVRYLSFCAPAAAVLVALGIATIGETVVSHWRPALTAVIATALVAASIPVYIGQRAPWAKDGGSDWRAVAEYVQRNASGGVVLFDQTTKPSRDPRLALDIYPRAFAALDDIALEAPFVARTRLWDRVADNADVTSEITGASQAWAVEARHGTATPPDVALLEGLDYHVESAVLIHRITVYHLSKE
ncbi:glycosyltransferase family 39 protein [Microbacterium yannicii]|uniref:Glycosyltransferase family 39 protein n=1 Tax=Microbacterium yannicii TaxID=671622 RepID=A0ABP9MH14_9MICO|nr:glycosyltransferase family 39 protein [Microbacterium yannicii]MCO5953260.1 glycosyltransferase family 39 protein [Microbacterium yannicii]